MKMEDLMSAADSGVKRGLDLGADEVEIYLVNGESAEVTLENNDVHLGRTDVKSGTGVRVFKRMGLGYASTNSVDEKEMVRAIERALQLAKHSPPEPWNELPSKARLKAVKGLYDPVSESFGTDDTLELAADMLRTAKDADKRITVDSGAFSASRGEEVLASSTGIQASERASLFVYYLRGMARDGDEVSNMDYSVRFAHKVKDVDVDGVAGEFAERVVSSLGARTVKSFEGPMIIGPKAGTILLGTVLSHAVNSDNVQKGMSRFAGKVGKKVASSGLDVVDDGLLEDGFATSSFDREGLPHSKIGLIEDGTLKSFIYNAKTAFKDKCDSTGHASGNEAQPPAVGITNIIVGKGEMSLSEMTSETERGLIVRRLSGYPDPLSGDFSSVVKGGFLVEKGEIVQPVTDTMVSGNVYDLLENIEAISKERDLVLNFTTPHMKVSGVAITGK